MAVIRRCAWCHKPPRWDDPLCSVQVNAEDAAPQTIEYIVGLWGAVKQGTMQGGTCRRCAAALTGQPEPLPIVYGPNAGRAGVENETAEGICSGDTFPICGICRQALYEGDGVTPIRLQPDELDLPADICAALKRLLADGNKPGARNLCGMYGVPQPGALSACPECLAVYKPRVLKRLHDAGLFLTVSSTERLSRAMLL